MRTVVAIIGAGPAGAAAAIQLRRYGIDFIFFEYNTVGGLLKQANIVENYPGFYKGIKGDKLCLLINKHLKELDIEIIHEKIKKIKYDNEFVLSVGEKEYFSEYCIYAAGTLPKLLDSKLFDSAQPINIQYGIENFKELKNKDIIIIGAGDAAFDYALNLSEFNRIRILSRRERISAMPLLMNRVSMKNNIEIIRNVTIYFFRNSGEKNIIEYDIAGEKFELQSDFIIAAIGRYANMEPIENNRDIINNSKFFLTGDVSNGLYRQASIAAGDGIKAAMAIYMDISKQKVI